VRTFRERRAGLSATAGLSCMGQPVQSSTRCIVQYAGDDPDPNEYPICGEMYQSPVDIDRWATEYAAEYAGLRFRGYDSIPDVASYKLTNEGHTGEW